MNPNTSPSSIGSPLKKKQAGYKVWHFALAVPAIAVTLQLFLGSLTPLPKEHNPYINHYASLYPSHSKDFGDYLYREHLNQGMPQIEILPLNLRGEMTGPILASVLQDYFPESTDQHATDLRDALPPCDDPRMIVILPKEDIIKPVF